MNGDPIARTSEDCTCLRSGYSHSYACRERLIDRQRAEIEQLTRERDAMQRRAESAEADWMALSQDDGKVERALERSEQENDRLRALLSEVLPQHVDQPRGWSGEWNGSEENTWVGRVRAELSGEHSAHETTASLEPVVYQNCPRHMALTAQMTVSATPYSFRVVCPICEPPGQQPLKASDG